LGAGAHRAVQGRAGGAGAEARVPAPVAQRYQHLHGLADEFGRLVTEECLRLPVDELNAAVGADDHHRIGRRVEKRRQARAEVERRAMRRGSVVADSHTSILLNRRTTRRVAITLPTHPLGAMRIACTSSVYRHYGSDGIRQTPGCPLGRHPHRDDAGVIAGSVGRTPR